LHEAWRSNSFSNMWGAVTSNVPLSDPDEDVKQMRMCVSGWWAAQHQSLVDMSL